MSTPHNKLQTKANLEMKSPQHTSNILSDAAVQDARETCEFVYTDSPPPGTCVSLSAVESEAASDAAVSEYVRKCGYDSDQVLQYVGELTDKALQHRLKDGRRNVAFRKLIVDDRQQSERLMCESDDIVLGYNCVSDNAYWFVKHGVKRLPPRDVIILDSI
ncbi:hypothetical protein BaRGS_00013171 [Batillaria attramentaria]|uniref:Uncharacterized protein n=1 Tax=Batillaria attramentaria TaxID=370345 RepID=A0ABD0L7M0_9CAEN